jgi:hypothetical protein
MVIAAPIGYNVIFIRYPFLPVTPIGQLVYYAALQFIPAAFFNGVMR